MSVDIWIFVALLFVSCSLVELAIVGHLHRMKRCRIVQSRAESVKQFNQQIDTLSVI